MFKLQITTTTKVLLAVLFLVLFLASGAVRVYYGAGMRPRIVFKKSWSLKDTVVCLDDILPMPRFSLATLHPAVKTQLEEMNVILTDAEVEARIEREIEQKMQEYQQKLERELERDYQQELQKMYKYQQELERIYQQELQRSLNELNKLNEFSW